MNKKVYLFLFLFLGSFFLVISCKKLILSIVADSLMYAFDLWEDRPEGIPCSQGLSNATFANQEIAFDHNHMLCINIDMDANDFKSMREESRFGPNIYDNEGNTACAVAHSALAWRLTVAKNSSVESTLPTNTNTVNSFIVFVLLTEHVYF